MNTSAQNFHLFFFCSIKKIRLFPFLFFVIFNSVVLCHKRVRVGYLLQKKGEGTCGMKYKKELSLKSESCVAITYINYMSPGTTSFSKCEIYIRFEGFRFVNWIKWLLQNSSIEYSNQFNAIVTWTEAIQSRLGITNNSISNIIESK